MINADGMKYLPVPRLVALLQALPAGCSIAPNVVGNLAVYDGDMKFIGFIDLLHDGEFEQWDDA